MVYPLNARPSKAREGGGLLVGLLVVHGTHESYFHAVDASVRFSHHMSQLLTFEKGDR
jgi:hypothetical protein